MPRTVAWSREALQQLAAIRRFVSEDKPGAAFKLALRIRNSTNILATFPDSGRVGLAPETREWVIPGTPFIAAYRVDEDEVVISKVLRGRRSWPKSF